jgi:1-deoxy-D-xylulose-5-phosphate synthase
MHKKGDEKPALTTIFGEAMVDVCKMNSKVMGITAAMPDGTGLTILQGAMPERFFDVGIAEQHGVTFAAGMATQGYIPVVAIYSSFLQRAFDQVIHDVALQHLHVVFVLDRGGLVGADGPTHHGSLDLAYLRCIQGMVVMAPKDEQELRDMLFTAVEMKGPVALRYPRGNAFGVPLRKEFKKLEIGKAETLRTGKDVAFLAIGNLVSHAQQAAEILAKDGIEVEVVNMRFVKPLDDAVVADVASRIESIVTIEDNVIQGGFGSAVLESLVKHGKLKNLVKLLGLPDTFVDHGTPKELHRLVNLDPQGIAETTKTFLSSHEGKSAVELLTT